MGDVLHTPLRSISDPDQLVELFWALPEKNIERISIIQRLEELAESTTEEDRETIQTVRDALEPGKQRATIARSLQVPWGDWSRVYRVRGLFHAIRFIEDSKAYAARNPNAIYNLAFLYYIAYSFLRDEGGKRNPDYRERALRLSHEAESLYRAAHRSFLNRYVALFGGMLIPEWRKNLSDYCASLATNIAALVYLLDNEIDTALRYINVAFDTHPTPPEVYFSLGVYFLKQGAFNPAIRMLKESVKRRGEHSAEAHYQLGRAYHAKSLYLIRHAEEGGLSQAEKKRLEKLADERIEKSLAAFQESAEEDPYFSLPYYWMGNIYLLRRNCSCEKAMGMFDFALQMDPETVGRYLRQFPMACRSSNRSCSRFKLQEYARRVIGGREPGSPDRTVFAESGER